MRGTPPQPNPAPRLSGLPPASRRLPTASLAFWVPAALGLATDLVSKHVVFAFLSSVPGQRLPLIGSWLVLRLQYNPNGVFGVRLPGGAATFVVLTLVALGVVGWMLRSTRPDQRLMQVALGLVAGGAVGNLADRLWIGAVRDFIYVEKINYPAFNLADSCICIAAALLIVEIYREQTQATREGGTEDHRFHR